MVDGIPNRPKPIFTKRTLLETERWCFWNMGPFDPPSLGFQWCTLQSSCGAWILGFDMLEFELRDNIRIPWQHHFPPQRVNYSCLEKAMDPMQRVAVLLLYPTASSLWLGNPCCCCEFGLESKVSWVMGLSCVNWGYPQLSSIYRWQVSSIFHEVNSIQRQRGSPTMAMETPWCQPSCEALIYTTSLTAATWRKKTPNLAKKMWEVAERHLCWLMIIVGS